MTLNKRNILIIVIALVCFLAAIISFGFFSNQKKVPILLYHNLVADGEETSSMSITKSKFENDIKVLSDMGYTFLLPSDLASGKSIPGQSVLISFDDGYLSNYEIAFHILKKYNAKAEVSVIVQMIDENREIFCTWDMLKEMSDSKVFEVGSHTTNCHNPDDRGEYVAGKSNGIQRRKGESREDYEKRVLSDIQFSFDRITEKVGKEPLVFTYPYGVYERYAKSFIENLFPISFGTKPGKANTSNLHKLKRFEVYEDTDITKFL